MMLAPTAPGPALPSGGAPEVVFECRSTKGEAFSVKRDDKGNALSEAPIANPDKLVVISREGAVVSVRVEGEAPMSARDLVVDSSDQMLSMRLRDQAEMFQVRRRAGLPPQMMHRLWDAKTSTETFRSLDTCSTAKLDAFPPTRTVQPRGQ
jgi:hypothetical protein